MVFKNKKNKLYKNKQNAPGCNKIDIKVKLWYAVRRYMNCTAAKYSLSDVLTFLRKFLFQDR